MRAPLKHPAFDALIDGADHVDVKTVEGKVDLRTFLAGMMAFQPRWLTALYVIRGGFVRLLGMRQKRQPVSARYTPADVPMQAGDRAIFFTIRDASEDHYWLAEIRDKHLDAALGVIVEPLDALRRRFHVVTIVHYNHWTGPVYFNVIRPFHHLVVSAMARAGVQSH
jgi:hypothetical protein